MILVLVPLLCAVLNTYKYVDAVTDLEGMLVQCTLYLQSVAAFMLALAQALSPMDAACKFLYILLIPGIEGHQWLVEFCCPLSLVTLGPRLQILFVVVQSLDQNCAG